MELLKKGVAMKATISGLGVLFLALALTTTAHAWYGYGPPPPVNAFTPSCCYSYWDTCSYGSCDNWPPCSQPFQGFRPSVPMGNDCGYRFARSPRDYFMVDP